jgi:hypothetical protein
MGASKYNPLLMIPKALIYSILSLGAVLSVLSFVPYSYAATFSGTVTAAATCGISFTSGTPVNYGTIFNVGDITSEQTVAIKNTGRSPMDVFLHGTDWTDGATTIMVVGDTHYSASTGTYGSKTALATTDGTKIFTLGNTAQKNSFWQLQSNLLNIDYTGTPSQTVTVTGIC